MKLEDQITNLDLSRRLSDLGVKQDSLFYWIKEDEPYIWYNNNTYPIKTLKFYYSAFTVAELSQFLPENIHIYMLKVNDINPTWFCEAGECNGEATNWEVIQNENQVNSIAKMLIHLIENELMEIVK